MPMRKDAEGSGRNADGSRNYKYCSYCYQYGSFLFKGDVEDMQAYCISKMKEQGIPKFIAWILTRNIVNLERWR